MSEKSPFDMLIEQFRLVVREEIAAAVQNSPKAKLVFSTAEAATILNVPETWLATAAREGKIPSVKIGHYVRFRQADLEAYIKSADQERQ